MYEYIYIYIYIYIYQITCALRAHLDLSDTYDRFSNSGSFQNGALRRGRKRIQQEADHVRASRARGSFGRI